MLTLLALLCPPRFCMLPSWKFTTLYHAICNMYPHAQCWHSLLYCALHASACFCPWNSQPFLYQAVCYTYYILCYIPHTVLNTYHILCYIPHTVCIYMLDIDSPGFIVHSTLPHVCMLVTIHSCWKVKTTGSAGAVCVGHIKTGVAVFSGLLHALRVKPPGVCCCVCATVCGHFTLIKFLSRQQDRVSVYCFVRGICRLGQNRIYSVCTVYMVISLPKLLYLQRAFHIYGCNQP